MTAIAFNVDADLKLYPVGLMRLPHCHAQRPENIQEATGDRLSAFELQDARHVRLCERLLSDVASRQPSQLWPQACFEKSHVPRIWLFFSHNP